MKPTKLKRPKFLNGQFGCREIPAQLIGVARLLVFPNGSTNHRSRNDEIDMGKPRPTHSVTGY